MNCIIGARGRLGQALCAALSSQQVLVPARQVYEHWWRADGVAAAAGYLSLLPAGAIVYVAAGMIDPAQPAEAHQRVNVLLPAHVIEAASSLGLRVVTFGSVMETIADTGTANSYIASKARLGALVAQRAAAGANVLHVRIHTLYGGGAPDPFMFLGQMLAALVARRPFRMSPGGQLREYHHVDDDALAILVLAHAELTGTLALSHAHPLSLKALATRVFEAFGCSDLLEVGALPAPPADNFGTAFERPATLCAVEFREALGGVVDYLRPFNAAAMNDKEPVRAPI
jgi:nucleoside-diphosphate-sugar epimerase